MIGMFRKEKISPRERNRVLPYLVFKIKHGANIAMALRSYMDGNRAKSSQPVQKMLDHMADGASFQEAALDFNLVDRYGFLILDSGIEASRSLPVVLETSVRRNFGVTAILLREIFIKYSFAVIFALAMASQSLRNPLLKIFNAMNAAAEQTGSSPVPLPAYLESPWLVMSWVIVIGALIASAGAIVWWINRYRSDLIYRLLPFRFYEDWSPLLALYLAFKHAGHSEVKAVSSLADSCPDGGFNQILFRDIADSMRMSGRNTSEVLEKYERIIPTEILGFFMDAGKTRQYDAYLKQAKDFCDYKLSIITEATRIWTPAITGVTLAMVLGLMAVDMFVKLTQLTMAPLM